VSSQKEFVMRIRFLRLLAGLVLLGALLLALFAVTLPVMHRWGASASEVAMALPGDNLLPAPQLRWTHGINIDAPPKQVWPWIAQLGDRRGGFYSFTFIENRLSALTGAADYQVVYHNANQIVPAWQQPQPGNELIAGVLTVREVRPGVWLLAESIDPSTFGWTWLWQLVPLDNGTRTRLVVRMAIQLPPGPQSPAGLLMDLGGFVMEQRMLHGIKLRAEGWREPAWNEAAEIGFWLIALLSGLMAAWLFVVRTTWQPPLGLAIVAVVVLFGLTFVQPPLWVRLLLDAALVMGVWWTAKDGRMRRGSSSLVGRTSEQPKAVH
jgi:hypothetical protein